MLKILVYFFILVAARQSFAQDEMDRIVTWRAVDGAVSYTILISKDAELSDPTTHTSTNPRLDVSLFKAGKYFFQVTAHDINGKSSPPSNTSSFSVETDPAELLLPKNNDTFVFDNLQKTITFIWSDALGLDKQFLQISPDADFTERVVERPIETNQFTWTPPKKDAVYFWRIVSTNGKEYRLRSQTFKVTVALPALPSTFGLTSSIAAGRLYLSPDNNGTHLLQATGFPFAKQYIWTLSRETAFTKDNIITSKWTKKNEWKYKFLPGIYFVRVSMKDIFDRQVVSRILKVLVKNELKPPVIKGDAEMMFESPSRNIPVELSWVPEKDAKNYLLQIARDDDFTQIRNRQELSTPSYKINLPVGFYYFRVMTVYNDGDKSPWSAPVAIATSRITQWAPQSLATLGYNFGASSYQHHTKQLDGTTGGFLPLGLFSSIENEFVPHATVAFKIEVASGLFSANQMGTDNPNQKSTWVFKLDSKLAFRYMLLERAKRYDFNGFVSLGIKYLRGPRFVIVPGSEVAEIGGTSYGAQVTETSLQHLGFELRLGSSRLLSLKSEGRAQVYLVYQTSTESQAASGGIQYGFDLSYLYKTTPSLFYIWEVAIDQFNQNISYGVDSGRITNVNYALKFGIGTSW